MGDNSWVQKDSGSIAKKHALVLAQSVLLYDRLETSYNRAESRTQSFFLSLLLVLGDAFHAFPVSPRLRQDMMHIVAHADEGKALLQKYGPISTTHTTSCGISLSEYISEYIQKNFLLP